MNTETFEPATEPAAPIEQPTVHLARCAECGFSVRYQPAAPARLRVLDNITDRTLRHR
jgi:hypothetical protein